MAKRTLCQRPNCVKEAVQRVEAEDTSYGFKVCYDDLAWAKRAIVEDMPGHAVTAEYLDLPVGAFHDEEVHASTDTWSEYDADGV